MTRASWAGRPVQPEPFVRGCSYPAAPDAPYPRADPADASRLPADTWAAARVPAAVRLEMVGDAKAVEITYRTATDELGYRGAGAGRTFSAWRGNRMVDEVPAVLGPGRARLDLRTEATVDPGKVVVYLPEGMIPVVEAIDPVGGELDPAPSQPRWLAYGDSIAEGWIASAPAGAWPAVAARQHALDVHNFGYAGSARGEIVSAEQLAALEAAVISVTHGTNCWTRVPHSAGMMREGTRAFLEVLSEGHPTTPIVVVSPVVRPDAERTPNRLGATLEDLRTAIEDATRGCIAAGASNITLVPGRDLLSEAHLADGIHPGDAGHVALAEALGPVVASAARSHPAASGV